MLFVFFMKPLIINTLLNKKSFALLIDPDEISEDSCRRLIQNCLKFPPDHILVGGSLIISDQFDRICEILKQQLSIPIIIFPNSYLHIPQKADGILFLSLISGRNADYLIGNQVIAAPILKRSGLEIIPTGYILVNCGNQTAVAYMSNTSPIPHDKNDIAICTAMAGEMLGLKMIYLEGGSGAKIPVSESMIKSVKKNIEIPLMVGGGIRTAENMKKAFLAGADIVVIGTAIEQKPELLEEFWLVCKESNDHF